MNFHPISTAPRDRAILLNTGHGVFPVLWRPKRNEVCPWFGLDASEEDGLNGWPEMPYYTWAELG